MIDDEWICNAATGRLLNYAARRTPIAVANKTTSNMNGKLTAEDSDDAFGIADAAIEKMIAGDFQPVSSGSFLFADPVFQDLVSALDIPTPAVDTIFDPERNV